MKKTDEAPVMEAKVEAPPVFQKEQVLKSKRYANRRDALSFLLEDGKDYTLAQIDGILETYMKGKVN